MFILLQYTVLFLTLNQYLMSSLLFLIQSPDQNPKIICEYVRESLSGRHAPLHTVAYDCSISATNVRIVVLILLFFIQLFSYCSVQSAVLCNKNNDNNNIICLFNLLQFKQLNDRFISLNLKGLLKQDNSVFSCNKVVKTIHINSSLVA